MHPSCGFMQNLTSNPGPKRLAVQFEKAATVGVVVVVALCSIIVGQAVRLGFPAVTSGELDVLAVKVRANSRIPYIVW